MLTGIEHVGICAKDTVALKDWYVKLFDLKVVYDNKKNPPTFFVKFQDGSMIEIYPASEECQPTSNLVQGVRHIALFTDNFQEDIKRLYENNVEIIQEPATNAKGVSTVFFRDPEGNILHYIQRPEKL